MRTAIDSSVLLAILHREPDHLAWQSALERASESGQLLLCPVAFAEVSSRFATAEELLERAEALRIQYDEFQPQAAWRAGQIFKAYRKAGGQRTHMIPDFMIAAHAYEQADQLASTDRGYLREYFPGLKLLSPSTA